MGAKMTTDKAEFRKRVEALARQYGHDVGMVMRRQVSIAGGQLIKAYPPKNAKAGGDAIANDLRRIILTAGPGDNADIKLKSRVRQGPDGKMILETPRSTLFIDQSAYMPPEPIASYHKTWRDARTGRVRGRGRWIAKRDGRNEIVNRIVVKPTDLAKYIREKKKNVGKLAAGWLPTLNIYRGEGAGKSAAKFVSRHAPGRGFVRDNMRADGSGYIEFVNSTAHASRWKRQNDFVLSKRERGMRSELAGAIRAAAKKTGNA